MPEFKIESHIPIPEDSEPDEPEVIEPEDTRWVPFKPHVKKCAPLKHFPQVGRCDRCGDIFPCPSGNCGHLDCADPSLSGFDCKGNGTEIPESISVFQAQDHLARARVISVEMSEEGSNETDSVGGDLLEQGS